MRFTHQVEDYVLYIVSTDIQIPPKPKKLDNINDYKHTKTKLKCLVLECIVFHKLTHNYVLVRCYAEFFM